jgi:maleate cis-trans isomerase
MSFLKHEKISLQKYSMLKIVQDKHLLKTLVATLIRIRRSKQVVTTAPTPKISAIVLSMLVCTNLFTFQICISLQFKLKKTILSEF